MLSNDKKAALRGGFFIMISPLFLKGGDAKSFQVVLET